MDTTRKNLEKQFGRQPTEIEVKTAVCEKEQYIHAKEWNWGLYRNDRFQIAEFHRAAGRIAKALKILIEVCYIDLNGPNNCGGMHEMPQLLKENPPFRPKPQGLAPAIIELINKMTAYLCLDVEQLNRQFLEIAKEVQLQIATPLAPSDAWMQLRPSISEGGKI